MWLMRTVLRHEHPCIPLFCMEPLTAAGVLLRKLTRLPGHGNSSQRYATHSLRRRSTTAQGSPVGEPFATAQRTWEESKSL